MNNVKILRGFRNKLLLSSSLRSLKFRKIKSLVKVLQANWDSGRAPLGFLTSSEKSISLAVLKDEIFCLASVTKLRSDLENWEKSS